MGRARLAAVLAGALLVSVLLSGPIAAQGYAGSGTAQTETAPLPLQQECAAVNIAATQLELAHMASVIATGAA